MKKILASLLVLALCAPAMAATVEVIDDADGTGSIVVTAEGADPIVGLGLDIVVTGANVTAVTISPATFNIYPDAAYTLETTTPGSYTYGAGSPVALIAGPGKDDLPLASFCISAGMLNGSGTPGADGAAVVTIDVETDLASGSCTVAVTENAARGGIVLTTGAGEDITSQTGDTITNGTPAECIKSGTALYTTWDSVGKPDCWCYAKQCRGDGDGAVQGPFWVGLDDLTGFLAAYNQFVLPAGGICYDNDRAIQGPFRVSLDDLTIFLTYYNQFVVPDCDMTDYNFWLTP